MMAIGQNISEVDQFQGRMGGGGGLLLSLFRYFFFLFFFFFWGGGTNLGVHRCGVFFSLRIWCVVFSSL